MDEAECRPSASVRRSAVVEITHAGGRIPEHARNPLIAALKSAIRDGATEVSVAVTGAGDDVVEVTAVIREANSVQAITYLDKALNDSLMAIDMFEDFDVTGKHIRVMPVESMRRHDR